MKAIEVYNYNFVKRVLNKVLTGKGRLYLSEYTIDKCALTIWTYHSTGDLWKLQELQRMCRRKNNRSKKVKVKA